MTDLVTFGEAMFRLSPPDGDRFLSADALDLRVGGAESNVAIAASRLGADTVWLSKLPDSMLGERVATEVRSHGVDVRAPRTDSGRLGTYYLERAGDPRGTSVVYDRDDTAVTTATPDDLDLGVLDSAAIGFTTGITPALSETLFETTTTVLERSDTAAFDLNYRAKLWSEADARQAYETLLPLVDVLFAPERDARSILGIEGDAETVAGTLRDRYDCSTVVVTRGDAGALATTNTTTVDRPAVAADTLDPVGTGDAFVGGYLSRFVRDADVTECLNWGVATAALKRTIPGDVALVSESDVRDVLDDDPGGIDR